MLVLKRRIGEVIVIQAGGQTIRVRPVRIDIASVKIGVEASQNVVIWREELARDGEVFRSHDAGTSPTERTVQELMDNCQRFARYDGSRMVHVRLGLLRRLADLLSQGCLDEKKD